MRLLLILSSLLFITTSAFGANYVCWKDVSLENDTVQFKGIKRVYAAVDGSKHGLANPSDNTSIRPDCFLATNEEAELAKFRNRHKVDMSIVGSSRVIPLTQAERNALNAFYENKQRQRIINAIDNNQVSAEDLARALIHLGIVDGATLRNKIKEIKGITP